LLAGSGTNTLSLLGLTATECEVPAGNTNALPAVLMVEQFTTFFLFLYSAICNHLSGQRRVRVGPVINLPGS
jgi:hypothetical protein